jgi:predicted nucleic acid-binding protein
MAAKAVRVFLDSNVILSGLISERGAPRVLLDLLSLGLPWLKGLTGEYNLMEIERNLAKKLPQTMPLYRKYLPKLHLKVIPLPTPEDVDAHLGVIADKDVPVLVSAINGLADYLVTGDHKDFGKLMKRNRYPFRIVTPADFLASITEEIIDQAKDDK